MATRTPRVASDVDTWAFDRSYRAIGYSFRVGTDLPRAADLIGRFLAPLQTERRPVRWTYSLGRSEADGFLMRMNGRPVGESPSLAGLLDQLIWHVNQQAIVRAKRFILVHAGAVSRDGVGITLPASGQSGKSTLVAGLIRAGFDYLSDEAAVLDPHTGWVQPYPKVVTLEPPSVEAIPGLHRNLPPEYGWGGRVQYHFSPDDLRAGAVSAACRVRYIITPRYEPGASTVLEPISRGTALSILAENTFNLAPFRARGVRLLGRVAQGAECYRLTMGDLESAVQAVRKVVR